MKHRIGIVTSKNQESGVISIPAAYTNYFANFGTIVPIFALDDYINRDIDLLVLIGGSDVNPMRYGDKPHFHTQNPNIELEYFDMYVLPKYIEINMPIFGICRGFQTLNVNFGGKLSQHINQKTSTNPSRTELVDKLIFTGTEASKIISEKINKDNKKVPLEVNSMHHQGVFMNQLGEGLIPIFTNSVYENVEAFKHYSKPIVGVQWHPEEIYDKYSYYEIQNLLLKSQRSHD